MIGGCRCQFQSPGLTFLIVGVPNGATSCCASGQRATLPVVNLFDDAQLPVNSFELPVD